jgi:RNA polymerase sigma factor (sigma-70 family)
VTAIPATVSGQPKQNIIQAVKDYGKQLFSFIRRGVDNDEDAEDILQDVWYQFTNVMDAQPVEQVGAWLYRVARNRMIDQYRKKNHENLFGDEDGSVRLKEVMLSSDPSPEVAELQDRFWERLFLALKELPEEQSEVFVLHELEDLSFNEISEQTGEKVNTLISRKRYAVLHLRKRLEHLYKHIIQQ